MNKKFNQYAITLTSSDIAFNSVTFRIEDVTIDKSLTFNDVSEMKPDEPTKLIIQQNTYIDLTTSGSVLCSGKTRSGKTTGIISLLLQALQCGRDNYNSEVIIIDPTSIKMLLDLLYNGSISKDELEERLTGSQYGRFKNQIENVYAKYLQNQAEQFRKKMIEQNKSVKVIWIYGASGTGKTSLAKEYAEKAEQEYFVTGSSRDIFQNYKGEHTLIMDELRPNVIPYADLLRILDPYENNKMLPARYHDKALACDLIIITTPYNPYEFYQEIFGDISTMPVYARRKLATDSFEQLLRRLSLVIEMNEYWINAVEYDSKTGTFNYIKNAQKKNVYSAQNRQSNAVNSIDLFNSIFD